MELQTMCGNVMEMGGKGGLKKNRLPVKMRKWVETQAEKREKI